MSLVLCPGTAPPSFLPRRLQRLPTCSPDPIHLLPGQVPLVGACPELPSGPGHQDTRSPIPTARFTWLSSRASRQPGQVLSQLGGCPALACPLLSQSPGSHMWRRLPPATLGLFFERVIPQSITLRCCLAPQLGFNCSAFLNLLNLYSAGHHPPAMFLETIQGSFPCSSKDITSGLGIESCL